MKAILTSIFIAALLIFQSVSHAQDKAGAFQFALIGDMPYSKLEEQQFGNLIRSINAKNLAFAVHAGDMQLDARNYAANAANASLPCNDEYDAWFLGMLQRIRYPVIITSGDNDWTDCHFLTARKAEPMERLARVRATFYPPGKSLGQNPIAVDSQSAEANFARYVENLRWSTGGVTFATLHIVGSNDNVGRTPEGDQEQLARKAAAISWMRAAFAKAKVDGSLGVALITQANPYFENHWPASQRAIVARIAPGAVTPAQMPPTPYDDFLTALAEELENYSKPVVYLHGDFHRYRIDHPLFSRKTGRRFENFVRVEAYGTPDIHWVKVTVDPVEPMLFRFDPQIVPENVMSRQTK